MNFKEIIADYKTKLEKELENFLTEKQKEASEYGPFIRGIVNNIKEYNLRGSAKRLRGGLIVLGHEAFSKNKKQKDVFRIACVMELVHSYFLMHDDIIDRDDLRRGKDSMHVIYKKIAEKRGFRTEKNHFGLSMAIMAGDICSSFAYETVLKSSFSAERKTKALVRFNEMIKQTCYGEILDVLGADKKNLSEKDILDIYLYKTACYTVEAPLQIGAILAGAADGQLKKISEYARPVGIVFQIYNDLSEIFVEEKKIDSKTASDLAEGKQPLIVAKALKKGSVAQKDFIKNLLGKEKISKDEIAKLKQVLYDTGAYEYCLDLARKNIAESKKSLEKMEIVGKPSKIFLKEFGEYLVKAIFDYGEAR